MKYFMNILTTRCGKANRTIEIGRNKYNFQKAILSSQNDEKIKDYKQDIERCEMKIEIRKKHMGTA